MKNIFTKISLTLVFFLLCILFQNIDIYGSSLTFPIAGAIGQMIGTFLISALVVFLLSKTERKNNKRLIVAIFIILTSLAWRFSSLEDFNNRLEWEKEKIRKEMESLIKKRLYQEQNISGLTISLPFTPVKDESLESALSKAEPNGTFQVYSFSNNIDKEFTTVSTETIKGNFNLENSVSGSLFKLSEEFKKNYTLSSLRIGSFDCKKIISENKEDNLFFQEVICAHGKKGYSVISVVENTALNKTESDTIFESINLP